jgi:hypothetical protein
VTSLEQIAPAFVGMAHSIVWASVATVDATGRPRTRIMHPIWQWDGAALVGWIATEPTPLKRAHLAAHPDISIRYWTTNHDTCSGECRADWVFNDEGRTAVGNMFKNRPAPVGYDPAMIPQWAGGATSDAFAALRLTPWRLP